MHNDNEAVLQRLEKSYLEFKRKLPRKVAVVAVNFYKRNFQVGGFVDKPFQKWKKPSKKGGNTLVKTGNLRRSVKQISVSPTRVVIGSDMPYAKIHNEGGKIEITPKMRRYFWAMFKKTKDVKYKAMALTKQKHLTMPKRQFIGDSHALPVALDRMIIKELKNTLQ